MSKLNSFRLINLNYNNNAIRIEDETFYLDGQSTLLSLQNGGGKSVLVQMLLAPFVHAKYRNTTDRQFASYFTTNKPTHLLVEWKIDGGAGYVLTGMMVRARQNISEEETAEELEIINFIYEYKDSNPYDIDHIPFVEVDKKVRKLKGFNACRTLFEERKKEKGFAFQYFDMTQSNQQRQYFIKLKEYGINYEEWETIIKKINLKESGLSELFKNAKDEVGLIEKWFLPAVESKLNRDGNRMKQFQSILLKYISQYKENQTSIERKATILSFNADANLIREEDNKYLQVSKERLLQQEKLAYFRAALEGFVKKAESEVEQSRNRYARLEEQKREIDYEQSSYELYQCADVLDSQEVLHIRYTAECEEQTKELAEIKHKLQAQECARLYHDYKHESREVLELENKLDVMKKDEQELIPERTNTGYNLRLRYEEAYKLQQETLKGIVTDLEDKVSKEQKTREQRVSEEKQHREFNNQTGQLTERIKQFDEKELSLNERYTLSLERNILGLYEEGALELLEVSASKQLEILMSQRQEMGQRKMNLVQQVVSTDRTLQDMMSNRGQLYATKEEKEREQKELQIEIEERIKMMRYLDLPKEQCFRTELILQSCDSKLEVLQTVFKEQERRVELIKEEYRKLNSGEVLTLPTEFKELLDDLELHYVMGMDWLKKNGYTDKTNQELLQKNPMIPYSIILSEQELNRLKKQEVRFFTSYPIPIICKEQLSKEAYSLSNGVYQLERLSLFVAFNNHLLNEVALQALLLKKQEELNALLEKCSDKKKNIEFYEKVRNDIYYQKVSKENYDELETALHNISDQMVELDKNLANARAQKANWEKEIQQLTAAVVKLEQEEHRSIDLLEDLKLFQRAYIDYQEQKVHFASLHKKVNKSAERIEELDKLQTKLGEQIGDLRVKLKEEEDKSASLHVKCNQFKSYQEGSLLQQDLEDIEARYQAITQGISGGVSELETNLVKANERLNKVQEQLLRTSNKYGISEVEYSKITPNDYEVNLLESKQELKQAAFAKQEKLLQKLMTDIAVKESELIRLKKDMQEKFEVNEPCRREQIIDTEFRKRLKLMEVYIKEERETSKKVSNLLMNYQACFATMTEFSDLRSKQEFDFAEELTAYGETSLNQLNSEKLLQFQGERIRDYRLSTNRVNDAKQTLSKLLERTLRKNDYEEEFFHKPLETMSELLDSPEVILEQLDIVLQSYETILEKLQVDINMVEQEKQKVQEMLLDYMEEIHKNLGKIDKNSTIMVKERAIKMLKLNLPSWEEQQNVYELRLKDYLEELTRRGLERLNQNGNIEELIGAAATTRNLYDSVVGIGAITIRLYKIEAQREYSITWAQVSKNSGGEGFLSAFAVLSCLLSYMRRDDTDLFVEREEGKVIVMDNPFAQTNASHLLIPLMDIAKKSNTQLICLTGLGGESIYNRFDNIFVLNLRESGLQKDTQYITSEQIKGDARIYNMSTSRVQVETMEQMELLF